MRRRRPERRTINPDPKFNDLQISKFMNYLLTDGKKGIAEKILYDAFDIVQDKSKKDPIDIFKKALNNESPHVEVKSKRAQALALRWIMEATRKRKNKTMAEKLYAEILDASQNKGSAIKKRDDTHKMAEANKAFAHFRW